MSERTNRILEILTDEKTAEVTSLAQRLQVSQVTIRKDLDVLETKGLIHRLHGYAQLSNPNNMNGRLAYHYEAKKEIAQAAADLVQDGDTIMIESGSCCAILADTLALVKNNLTIITNSAFIASYISSSDTHVILLGGEYQKDSQVNVGPLVRLCAENWCVSRFFIGADGYSSRFGFSNADPMRAQAVRDMALQTQQVVVLTESSKFTSPARNPLNLKNGISTVITDSNIPASCKEELIKEGITLITC